MPVITVFDTMNNWLTPMLILIFDKVDGVSPKERRTTLELVCNKSG